jgi:hypothetical protein
MEVHFTPEQRRNSRRSPLNPELSPERLVTTVVARYLDEETRFLAAVEKE